MQSLTLIYRSRGSRILKRSVRISQFILHFSEFSELHFPRFWTASGWLRRQSRPGNRDRSRSRPAGGRPCPCSGCRGWAHTGSRRTHCRLGARSRSCSRSPLAAQSQRPLPHSRWRLSTAQPDCRSPPWAAPPATAGGNPGWFLVSLNCYWRHFRGPEAFSANGNRGHKVVKSTGLKYNWAVDLTGLFFNKAVGLTALINFPKCFVFFRISYLY